MSKTTKGMGLFSCIALTTGACIGSAIFSISGVTIAVAGGAAIISWLIAAAIYAAYGTIVGELAVRYPQSGGIFIFPKRSFGGKTGYSLGFISSWGYVISNTIAIGFSAIYLGIYLEAGFPEFCRCICPAGLAPSTMISILAMILCTALILCGGKISQRIQDALVVMLVATMLMFILTALTGGIFSPDDFKGFFTRGSGGGTGFISAIPTAMVAYGGCIVICFMTSEVSNPTRNVPRSLYISLITVALIYAATIACTVAAIPVDKLRDTPSLTFIPLSAAISDGELSSFKWMAEVISICGALALTTTITALMRVNARALQAMSRGGYLPDSFSKDNRRGAATMPLLVMFAAAVVLCLLPGQTMMMINLGAVLNIVSMTLTCASLAVTRRKDKWRVSPDSPAGIALPAAVTVIFWICYIPGIIKGGDRMWLFTFAIYLAGIPLYYAGRNKSGKRITGIIVHGKGHGHLHSMPTANLKLHEGETLPPRGVWETKVFLNGKIYRGMTNVGTRPSDDNSPEVTVETFIADFSDDIYNREMTLEFVRFIRQTMRFENLDKLKEQIDKDLKSSGIYRSGRSPEQVTGRLGNRADD